MAPCVKVGKYLIKKKLGEGAFAEVRLAVHIETSEEFAVKVFDKASFPRADFEKDVKREIKIMQYLRHPNIVSIEAVLITARKMYLVMELVRGGELYDEIVRKTRIDETTSRHYFQQIVDAMVYCHRRGVVHRDLKPENLLLEGNGTVKITDFGMSWMKENIDPHEKANRLLQTQCGTPKYMAPEIIMRPPNGYDGEKLDAWECGMVLYALLAGYLPFSGSTDNAVFRCILRGEVKFPSHFSPGVKDLLSRLLEKDPHKRSSLGEIRGHYWFRVDYHGDATKERDMARRLVSRNSMESSASGGELPSSSIQPSTSDVLRKGDVAEATTGHQGDEALAGAHVNEHSGSKGRQQEKSPQSFKDQVSSRAGYNTKPTSSSRLTAKVQNGKLVLSDDRDGNSRVAQRPKAHLKIAIGRGNLANDSDEELEEIAYPQTPRHMRAPLKVTTEDTGKMKQREESKAERIPRLPLNVSSQSDSNGGEETDSPISFRDRLLSPFGNLFKSVKQEAVAENEEVNNPSGEVNWFAETSPVSVADAEAGSASSTPKPMRSAVRGNLFKSPRAAATGHGFRAVASEDVHAKDDGGEPTPFRLMRKITGLRQKKS